MKEQGQVTLSNFSTGEIIVSSLPEQRCLFNQQTSAIFCRQFTCAVSRCFGVTENQFYSTALIKEKINHEDEEPYDLGFRSNILA